MKITKFVHSCLLVETTEPTERTTLFDPGSMSAAALSQHDLESLDDIVVTHVHSDHFDLPTIKRLVGQFPEVRITSTPEVVEALAEVGITASTEPAEGMSFFDSPHEQVEPIFPQPQEVGVHYLNKLSHPGDSHSFHETKDILALPITGPWGSTIKAAIIALEMKPKHVIPIHDWHLREESRIMFYDLFEQKLAEQGITFHKMETGVPITIEL